MQVQHPVPIEPPAEAPEPAPRPLMLTKKVERFKPCTTAACAQCYWQLPVRVLMLSCNSTLDC